MLRLLLIPVNDYLISSPGSLSSTVDKMSKNLPVQGSPNTFQFRLPDVTRNGDYEPTVYRLPQVTQQVCVSQSLTGQGVLLCLCVATCFLFRSHSATTSRPAACQRLFNFDTNTLARVAQVLYRAGLSTSSTVHKHSVPTAPGSWFCIFAVEESCGRCAWFRQLIISHPFLHVTTRTLYAVLHLVHQQTNKTLNSMRHDIMSGA